MARSGRSALRRFLRTVAPGPPGPAGVPVDREAESAQELAPVFEALDDALAEAGSLRDRARQDADERRQAADDEAARLLADARSRADAARADAAQAAFGDVDREREEIDADASAEIDAFRARAGEKRRQLVAALVEQVRRDVGLPADGHEPEEAAG